MIILDSQRIHNDKEMISEKLQLEEFTRFAGFVPWLYF